MDLAAPAIRHPGAFGVEDLDPHVRQRNADPRRLPAAVDPHRGRVHGGFGRTIGVEEPDPLAGVEPTPHRGRNRFAGHHHRERRQPRTRQQSRIDHAGQLRRRAVEQIDGIPLQQREQFFGILLRRLRHHHHAVATEQAAPPLYRYVEGQRSVHRRAQRRPALRVEDAVQPAPQVDHRGVRHFDALRLSGRTGGVDHIGATLIAAGIPVRFQVVARLCRPLRRVFAQIDQQRRILDARQRTPQNVACLRVDQHRNGFRIRHHIAEPFLRIGRIDRHVGASRLERREDRFDHAGVARHAYADIALRPDAMRLQVTRQAVGRGVRVAVADGVLAAHDRERLRIARGLRFDQPMNQDAAGRIGIAGVVFIRGHIRTLD